MVVVGGDLARGGAPGRVPAAARLGLDAEGRVVDADAGAQALLGPLDELLGRAVVVHDEAAEAERAERRGAEERALAALDSVSRELVTRDERADVDAALVRAACAVTGATGGAVFAEHEDGGLLVTHAAGWNRKGARVLPGAHSGAALVHETGEPLFAPDAQADPRLSSSNLVQSRAASVAIWPVTIDGRTAGAVLVWWAAPLASLSDRSRRLLDTVAASAAVAIERRSAFGRLELLSRTDPLTGIANRRALDAELARRVAAPLGGPLTVALLDLDLFKAYNDRRGHLAGDALLKSCTTAWREALRDGDLLARFGGEEFAVVLAEEDADAVHATIERLRRLMPDGQTCSAGVARWDGAEPVDALLGRADMALYEAKAGGRDIIRVAAQRRRRAPAVVAAVATADGVLRSAADLRRALEEDRFELHYQPVVDAGTRVVTGLEAMLRCRGDGGELLSPLSFIPLAERTGVIVPLGHWVIETACAQAAAWRAAGLDVPPVGVNVSPRQLDGPDVAEIIAAALARHGLDPRAFVVEITESALMSGPEPVVALLDRLKRLGVRCALDDFGAGHSSLGRLSELPLEMVKVDRSLVRDVASDARARRLLEGVIALIGSVGPAVLAEGVETEAQREICAAGGAQWLQGYLFARPEPAEVVVERLRGR